MKGEEYYEKDKTGGRFAKDDVITIAVDMTENTVWLVSWESGNQPENKRIPPRGSAGNADPANYKTGPIRCTRKSRTGPDRLFLRKSI